MRCPKCLKHPLGFLAFSRTIGTGKIPDECPHCGTRFRLSPLVWVLDGPVPLVTVILVPFLVIFVLMQIYHTRDLPAAVAA
jgi:hypothetical protein